MFYSQVITTVVLLKNTKKKNDMKKFIKCLNEYHTELLVVNMDKVYEGYKLYVTKIESKNSGKISFEISSNHSHGSTAYSTEIEAIEYITNWQTELN